MKKKSEITLLLAFALIACCLRAPITGVGSMLSLIKESLGVNNSIAGMLTTIPLFTFGIVSAFVGRIGEKFGAGYTLLYGVGFIVFGLLIRSFLGTVGLFLGTVIIGCGIAVGNVLIPGFIKAAFPKEVGPATSVYVSTMTLMASISSAVSVPVAMAFNWKIALCIWIIIAVPAFLVWFPRKEMTLSVRGKGSGKVAKDPMTWFLALYMGIQSLLFYCTMSWFATIMQSKGFDPSTAGYIASFYVVLGLPANFLVPLLTGKMNKSVLGVIIGLINVVGLIALNYGTGLGLIIVALICTGLCQGSTLSFAMTLFGIHTSNPSDAAELSGLTQSVGYLVAAIGPTCMGYLYDSTQSWSVALWALTGFAVLITVLGYIVGKDKIIGE